MDRPLKRRSRRKRVSLEREATVRDDREFASLDIMASSLLDRLPLADAILTLMSYALTPDFLDQLYETHRGHSFKKLLTFPSFVQLIADALLQHNGSGRQSFCRAEEHGILPTSIRALYSKLAYVPLSLSVGFVEESARRLSQLYPAASCALELPCSLQRMTPVILDGKTIKKVARRLKATRAASSKLSGGKLLVAIVPTTGLVVGMAADPDGETNEAKLVPDLLSRIANDPGKPNFYIADRQHGDPVQMERYTAGGNHALVRWDGKTSFEVDPNRPAQHSKDQNGRDVVSEWGWLGAKSNRRRRYARRITLIRPGDDEDVILLTDLLEEELYPASDLLKMYLARWGIERIFQQITEVFSLAQLIGSTPRATVFQASFCLVLYNLIQVMRGLVAESQNMEPDEISSEQIFNDTHRQLIALSELAKPADVAACLDQDWTIETVLQRLRRDLHGLWKKRWKKAVNKNPRKQKPQTGSSHGAHESVQRLIIAEKEEQSARERNQPPKCEADRKKIGAARKTTKPYTQRCQT